MSQDTLTIGGIGSDPSGAYTPINIGWSETYSNGAVQFLPPASGIWDNPGAIAAGKAFTYYSTELLMIGGAFVGGVLSLPASGDAQIKWGWEYFNSEGTNMAGDLGSPKSLSGGTWVSLGTTSASAAKANMAHSSSTHTDAIQKGSKLRVVIEIEDANNDGITTTIVNAAHTALNHVTTGAYVQMAMNKTNDINLGVTIGGMGADPS